MEKILFFGMKGDKLCFQHALMNALPPHEQGKPVRISMEGAALGLPRNSAGRLISSMAELWMNALQLHEPGKTARISMEGAAFRLLPKLSREINLLYGRALDEGLMAGFVWAVPGPMGFFPHPPSGHPLPG